MKDPLVRWAALVTTAAFAAWASLGVYGPGGWVTIAIAVVSVASFWIFAFAAVRQMVREESRDSTERSERW
jgi:heme exporter protein D